MDEFALNFTGKDSLTPIDIVSDITGLTFKEIRDCLECVNV